MIEPLESRRLLSGNVLVSVTDSVLRISGDVQSNSFQVRSATQPLADATVATAGTTSVSLDAAVLASVNLAVSSASSPGTPAAGFDVGFPLTGNTDFVFNHDSFAPISGVIRHIGTVSFNNNTITVGNFDIGFDATRVGGDRSGFFVRDTVGGLGILFDVANPGNVNVSTGNLQISSANLLISQEFSDLLQSLQLAAGPTVGVVAGAADVDVTGVAALEATLEVIGLGATTINGGATFNQPLTGIRTLRVNTGAGDNLVYFDTFRFNGVFSIEAGAGNDQVFLNNVALRRSLNVNLGGGNDSFNAAFVRSPRALVLDGGAGNDTLIRSSAIFGDVQLTDVQTVLPA